MKIHYPIKDRLKYHTFAKGCIYVNYDKVCYRIILTKDLVCNGYSDRGHEGVY